MHSHSPSHHTHSAEHSEHHGHHMGCSHVGCSSVHEHEVSKRPHHHHSNRLAWVMLLTTVYMLVEIFGGLWTHSLALLGDAGHMFCDTAALGLAWFASWIAQKPQNASKTYGYYRAEILAAFANGIVLMLVSLAISVEALHRFVTPEVVHGEGMIGIAAGGLLVNIIAAVLLHGDSEHNLNVKAAWIHVMSDALGSVGALLVGVLISFGASPQIDAVVSLFIVVLIVMNAWRLLDHTIHILLEASPRHLNTESIQQSLADVANVRDVHDLHVWSITTGQDALSVHLTVETTDYSPQVLFDAHAVLQNTFGIRHATIQIEPPHFVIDEETHQH